MKKCICLCLIAVLLLSGCKKDEAVQTQPATTVPATTAGLYNPDHPVEQETVGAVRAYPLTGANYWNIVTMGSKLLLLQEDGSACVLQGEHCEVIATGNPGIVSAESIYSVGVQGVAVYQEESNEVVLFNPQLQEAIRFPLPEDIQGKPVISMESNEIFYCQDGTIRAINMENNVPRLLKKHAVTDQTLTGCYFGGKVLRCETVDDAQQTAVLYLSADNGLVLSRDEYVQQFQTAEDRYFIERLDNGVKQNVVGTFAGEPRSLQVSNGETVTLCAALAMGGVVSYHSAEDGLALAFHNLDTEQLQAQILLKNIPEPVCVAADKSYVWMICGEDTQQVLYRWDLTKSPVAEPVFVVQTLYTAQAPDTEGIAACQERVDALNKQHGVKIQIWQDAAKTTDQYVVVPEYQTQIINRMLDQLEPALQSFPERFLSSTIRSGKVQIGLVRSIADGHSWVQFREDGNLYILISSQTDAKQAFMEAIGYGIDSHVIGNSRDYDTWSKLNPEGFAYGEELPVDDSGKVMYLEGENRAFVSQEAMESPVEDRRLLFVAAVTEGNAEVFASDMMQTKLRRMCEGIREAYGLDKKKELYLWEQYLNEPMVEVEPTNG